MGSALFLIFRDLKSSFYYYYYFFLVNWGMFLKVLGAFRAIIKAIYAGQLA
jgi:hypothetical protein